MTSHTEIEWTKSPNRHKRSKYTWLMEKLRDYPGAWAVRSHHASIYSARATAYRIKYMWPEYDFTVEAHEEGTGAVVYVRFRGEL